MNLNIRDPGPHPLACGLNQHAPDIRPIPIPVIHAERMGAMDDDRLKGISLSHWRRLRGFGSKTDHSIAWSVLRRWCMGRKSASGWSGRGTKPNFP